MQVGVAQGVELLERQQLDWERKRAARFNVNAASNPARKTLNDAAALTSPRQRSNPSLHPGSYRGGTGGGGGYPQDNHSAGVPTTVHLSGDGDDVSESLKDEAMAAAQGKKKEMRRVNSIAKILKTPLKSTQILKRSISDRLHSETTTQNNSDPISPTNNSNSNNSTSTTTMKPILYGYLQKLGRNGKWQKRFFESDGTSLLYYKNKQRTTILATLDLLHVGKIQLDNSDPLGCTFMIEVKGRDYYLCAETRERARDWVISLNRVKEARMQIGGLKLIEPFFEGNASGVNGQGDTKGVDQPISDGADEDEQVAPRIVMVAARKRLKGLGKDDFSEMERSLDEQNNSTDKNGVPISPVNGSAGTGSLASNPNSPKPIRASGRPHVNLLSAGYAVQHSVAVRWTKRRNSMQNFSRRLSRWAKRLTMIRCIVKDDVVHLNSQNLQQHEQLQQQQGGLEDAEPKGYRNRSEEQSFIDLGAPSYSSYSELYSEQRQFPGRPSNGSGEATNISPKESISETSVYHTTQPAPAHLISWKTTQTHRKKEANVQEEVETSSGRATPNEEEDENDEGSGVIA